MRSRWLERAAHGQVRRSFQGGLRVVTVAALACGPAGKQVQPPAPVRPFTVPRSEEPTLIDDSLRPLINTAVADLARRLRLDPTMITVVEARSVVWPDGGLGCPRPGMIYPQVQQDGALIRLRAQGRDFAYHSGGSRPIFLCEKPT
jgi:hypothetical protein